ncbi:MAG TPA: MBOAT family O-acyltransferase [Fontimonas sp.]
MLFNSWTFLAFFAVVLALNAAIKGWPARKRLLLVASYLFYAAWHPPYALILFFSTFADWMLARWIWRTERESSRRALLILSLIANLGLLGFFKYGGFMLENFQLALAALGVNYRPPEWSIVLPVGISFYTFASLSYTIDVYRRHVRGDASLLDYALFVSFFPHLVAGPIVRASVLLPQLGHERRATQQQFGWGLSLLIIGLFCKVVLADYVFAPVVDDVYSAKAFGTLDAWCAVLGFSGQIFYDFSGYSLCAIGIALCFGFSFPDNFLHPYAARGFSDFWRRWHISLSSWLRDYLYVPLGGNRGRAWKTYRNLMLTMLIGGLWHGASWMFILWGTLHGMYLSLERLIRGPAPKVVSGRQIALTTFTFIVVTLTWIPFRAPDAVVAWNVFSQLFSIGASNSMILTSSSMLLSFAALGVTLAWHGYARDRRLEEIFGGLSEGARGTILALSLLATFLCSGGEERAFIYFQF